MGRGTRSSPGKFLPTPSARRATGQGPRRPPRGRISTHALREEGDHRHRRDRLPGRISTHALREEGDLHRPYFVLRRWPISTHALREEGDGLTGCSGSSSSSISTHALREEGDTASPCREVRRRISTHALREEGDVTAFLYGGDGEISTHALREEGDDSVPLPKQKALMISTHALREEGDSPFCATLSLSANFYPRPPRGGRRASPSWTTAAR